MTPEQVKDEINRLLSSIGLTTAPWAQQLLKSANSKNIDISEWNTFILKVAEVAASASALHKVAELLAALDLDPNIGDGDDEKAPGAVYQKSSKALSPYAAGLGHDCVAGGKGYKVEGIVLKDGTVVVYPDTSASESEVIGYRLRTTEGLTVGRTCSVRLKVAAYDCGKILEIDDVTNYIRVENAPQIKGFNSNSDIPEDGFVANVLTIKGHPELGDVDVGYNAFTTGNNNYVSERNGFSAGSNNHVLGCNGATFGEQNEAGYDALVWGKGNKALIDQSAVGGKYADQSPNALLTLGNGHVDADGVEHRSNAFEARLDGTVTVGTPKEPTDSINAQVLHSYLNLNADDESVTGFSVSVHNNGTASITDGAGASGAVTIPGVYSGYLIQDIAKKCFESNSNISEIDIQEGVQVIYAEAFKNCRSLSKIQLPNTLSKIDYGAFQNTALSSINLPESLKSIHLNAFRNVPLTCTINIPKNCRYIGYNHDGGGSDTGCVFTSKSIPAIVFDGIPVKISPNAFKGCVCDIYVPWCEGEVEGAPWETTGAIHYAYSPGEISVEIVQETGESIEAVMSQKASTESFVPLRRDKGTYPSLYQVSTDGNNGLRYLQSIWQDDASVLIPYSAAQRDQHGCIQIGTPKKSIDAANKKFVEDEVAKANDGNTTILYWTDIQGGEYVVAQGEYCVGFCDETGNHFVDGLDPTNGSLRIPGYVDALVVKGDVSQLILTETSDERGVIVEFNDPSLAGFFKVLKFRELPCPCGPVTWVLEVIN